MSIRSLFARIRRNWPLVTRARLNRVIDGSRQIANLLSVAIAQAADANTKLDHARGQCDRAKQERDQAQVEAEENRRQASAMQIRLTELMRVRRHDVGSISHGWAELAREVIHQAKDSRTRHIAVFVGKPELKRTPFVHNAHAYTERTVDMHRFSIEIGLSPDTPPELVAGQIADHVRAAVLEQWRSQSILLTKETP